MRTCSTSSPLRARRSGVAALEFGLVMPLLVMLLLGLWEMGRAIQVFQTVSNAAREGARQASTAKYTREQVRQSVFEFLQRAGVPLSDTLPSSSVTLSNTNAVIIVENLTTGGEVFEATQLDRIQVTVEVPVRNYRWVLANTFLNSTSAVKSVVGFLCTRDVPIAITVDIPMQPLPPS
ncbi:MAG: TadE/TadG family type IV pilus assembly protein [Gemmataceae bacterium]